MSRNGPHATQEDRGLAQFVGLGSAWHDISEACFFFHQKYGPPFWLVSLRNHIQNITGEEKYGPRKKLARPSHAQLGCLGPGLLRIGWRASPCLDPGLA